MNERSRAVWLLIPITALTTNLHLIAVVIPMWAGAMLAGALIEQRRVSQTWLGRPARAQERSDLLIQPAHSLRPPLHRLHHRLLPHPHASRRAIQSALHYQSADVMVASRVIAEMQPIYRGTGAPIALTLLALVWFSAFFESQKLRPGEWLCLLLGTLLMLRLGRFAPIFGMFAAPILAASMPTLSDRTLARRPVQIAVAVVLIFFAGRILASFPGSATSFNAWLNRPGHRRDYPTESADWLDANIAPISGRILNDFTWGGYLEWRLNPKFQTLLDGRTQLFTAEFWNQTLLQTDPTKLADFLQKQHADAAIVSTDKSALRPVLLSHGWTIAHQDTVAEVLLPPPNDANGHAEVELSSF